MRKLSVLWRTLFDVRPGEGPRTLLMALYLLFVLFAYYILKPVSRALFLSQFDIDKLPWLYVLIAAVGGVLAYYYTKIAVRFSLRTAVLGATLISVFCLVLFWWLLRYNFAWMLYLFNIWVSLFSIVLVSQGWLVAANVFDARQAKRLYGILGLGAVFGAAFGGSFTALTVQAVGTANLLLASAFMVALSYGAFRLVAALKGVKLARARAAEEEPLSFGGILGSIGRHHHLQVIIGIIVLTYVVDVLVEYQFSAQAKAAYPDREDLTAFLGTFYGLWVNLIEFFLQFFLTAAVMARFGVGGALQIMPISVGLASLAAFLFPGLGSAAATRLTEAAVRYSFNRTGMELLYLPLPADLKNRTKAFVDIFADRMSRGLGGLLLVFLTGIMTLTTRNVALVAIFLCLVWILLAWRARAEYIATVRKRLELRRLDIESARVTVRDPATLNLLEETARGENPRQAAYALSLLAEVQGYRLDPLLASLASSPSAEIRGKVFELAAAHHLPGLLNEALSEIRRARPGHDSPAVKPAVGYAVAHSDDGFDLAGSLLDHPNYLVAEAAVESFAAKPDAARDRLGTDWLAAAVQDPDPDRRSIAAVAIRVRGDEGTEALYRLLADPHPRVATAAFDSAARLKNRAYVLPIIRRLPDARVRGRAIEALAAYGPRIVGTLGDILVDDSSPLAVRRQVPRVLRLIPDQRSVDLLMSMFAQPDLAVRSGVLRALNHLRETAPNLNYGPDTVTRQILAEARYYFELLAALAPFREQVNPSTAAGLLNATLAERLRRTVERLFRLLGLRYPPKEIYAAYLAVNRGRPEDLAAALEFLDNVLDRQLKRILLPLLDAPAGAPGRGRELFGIEDKTPQSAIRELIASGDPWLACCAVAAASELGLAGLASDIAEASEKGEPDLSAVARDALRELAQRT